MTRGHGRKKSPDISQQRPVLPTAAQSAVTRLQLSATRVHAPSDSHNLDTDCGGQGWPSHPLPHASPTQYGDWQRNFERVFISLADTPGPEGKGIMVMDWRSSFCPLIASIVPGTRATYRGRIMASSYHRSPKEMEDCKVDGFIKLSIYLLMLTPISSLVARESASASEIEWQD